MLYILFPVLIVICDFAFKKWILASIPLGGSLPFIPKIMHLTYVQNTGAAFSIFRSSPAVLTAFIVIAVAVLTVFAVKGKLSPFERFMLCGVIGGAAGNLIDRALYGYVVDMFAVDFMNFAVFNIADCFIVVCGIAFCVAYFIDGVNESRGKNGE